MTDVMTHVQQRHEGLVQGRHCPWTSIARHERAFAFRACGQSLGAPSLPFGQDGEEDFRQHRVG